MGDTKTQRVTSLSQGPEANDDDLHRLVANLPGVLYRVRPDERWTLLRLSGQSSSTLGVGADAVERGDGLLERFHPDDRGAVAKRVSAAIDEGVPFQLAHRIVTPGGEMKWVFGQGAGVVAADGSIEAIEGYLTDVSEQKRLEQELARASTLAMVGQLASGVAHDLNNILTAVTSLATFICQELPEDSAGHQDAVDIVDGARRAAGLTRQIVAFSRARQVVQPQVLEPDVAVDRLAKLLRRVLGDQVDLTVTLSAPDERVMADPSQFEQIVVNLVVNARDAMPEGGRIALSTRAEEGRYLLSVDDGGVGIADDALPHIFEPFFTTKEQGRGTGLGLATVSGIVSDLGGDIEVRSKPGEGTTFTVALPSSDVAPPAAAERRRETSPRAGTETVLVVEDDYPVRRAVARALRHQGYEALEARTASEALMWLEHDRGQAIQLLITDVVMPALSGPELAQIARRTHPRMPVLFISGYSEPPGLIYEIPEQASLLTKPFSPEVLIERVRSALDGPVRRSA